jgi:glycosyltransferase involved in cell wall biosynthesis
MLSTADGRGSAGPPELSILIPVFNERATIRQVIEKVRRIDFRADREIIVVDDGSTDGTGDILASEPEQEDVRIVCHARNGGKGSAIQTALRHARGRFVVIQDADLELNPEDIIPLFEVVRSGRALVCYGSRFMGDCRRFIRLPTYWANRILTLVCNLLNGQHLTDMNTCYKMMRADVARQIRLFSRGFAMEPEITTKLGRMGVRIVERPISYQPRSKAEGKKIRSVDLLRYLVAMVRYRFFRQAAAPVPIPERNRANMKSTSGASRIYAMQTA